MVPRDASIAASWIRPHLAVPMHYNPWPGIRQGPVEFRDPTEMLCDSEAVIMEAGDTLGS